MDRLKVLPRLIYLFFIPLFCGIFYLQIIRYFPYKKLSERNCLRIIDLDIPRGTIFDRKGEVLVADRPCFNLCFIPFDLKDCEKTSKILAPVLNILQEKIKSTLRKKYSNPFEQQFLKRDLGGKEIAFVEEENEKLPGLFIQVGLKRDYKLGRDASLLLGYTGEVSPGELERLEDVKSGDLIGKEGIEKVFDAVLKGKRGGIRIEVDAWGHKVRTLGKKESSPGNNIILSVDLSIQESAAKNLGDYPGSVVAMDPRNGEILALVSKPSFDPDDIQSSLRHPGKPFLNRALQGCYAPGSIYKICTELAALEKKVITPTDKLECKGILEVAEGERIRLFHCWVDRKTDQYKQHGWIDINTALPQSCNIFFGQIGLMVGAKDLLDCGEKFGLGAPTGIDLPGEKSGYIPPPEYSGGALNLSIGQGALLVTPIQLARFIATIANGGNLWQPQVTKQILDPAGNTILSFPPHLQRSIFIPEENLAILREGLYNVVEQGTGINSKVPGLSVCGKTGTAQIAKSELDLPTHGAFVCYAPRENPVIALCVFLDRANSAEAAIIAGRILQDIFFPAKEKLTTESTEKNNLTTNKHE
ncbi:MAG: penicillin-binding protein 2 [Candidatus Omnitrophica bacterium CG1_02_41_171]|nr:MAG: penicillin-binding protein 2 [Candidatus Omnitrophica bacterium CG1_02_41_171]